jgi:hypothetical protein
MMRIGDYLAVWISDQAAKLFLNIDRDPKVISRWAVIGKVETEPQSIGIWISVDRVEEHRPNEPLKFWKVTPDVCLIRWDFIITAQFLGKDIANTKNPIGFQFS